jgi:hypothetical protein
MYEGVRKMQEKESSRDVSARAAINAIRGNMSNQEVMQRFKISARGFADLLKQLFEKKLISEEDMVRRGIRFKIVKASAEIEPEPEPSPVPKPRIATPPTPRVMASPKSNASRDKDEEFLDTVELTKLFTTFGPTEQADSTEQAPQQDQEENKEESEETTEKKNKFSISGFFKRGR